MPRNEPAHVFRHIAMRGKDECWPWLGTWGGRSRDRRPYFMSDGRRTMAYRWVYELVHGDPIPDDRMVLHSCDNGGWPIGCCNPAHMRLGDKQDNSNDMTDRQRHGLPGTVVHAIRSLLEMGRTQQSIADLYGISRETVSAIATQRVYNSGPRARSARTAPQQGQPNQDRSDASTDSDHNS